MPDTFSPPIRSAIHAARVVKALKRAPDKAVRLKAEFLNELGITTVTGSTWTQKNLDRFLAAQRNLSADEAQAQEILIATLKD